MAPRPTTMPRGTGAATRRREKRAARTDVSGVSKAPDMAPTDSLLAAATGSTSLPLSDRDAVWDAGAAEKGMSPAQYPDGHFWVDPDGDPKTLAAYKLPFASADGGLTAVWKGVTACAGAIQGARGGVKIPDGDVAGVKAKIAAYYKKAADQYDDPAIKVPWDQAETAAVEDEDERGAVKVTLDVENEGECANCSHLAEAHGGDMNGGACAMNGCDCGGFETAKKAKADIEGSVEPFQHTVTCECGHSLGEHTGVDGPCGHEDGRGTCRCGGFAEMSIEEVTMTAETLTFTLPVDHKAGDKLTFRLTDFTLVTALPPEEVAVIDTLAPGEVLPPMAPTIPEAVPVQPTRKDGIEWQAVIAPEGALTSDGRAFAPGAISWRELPLTLGAMLDTPHADVVTSSEACGRIDQIWRDGSILRATGIFDAGDYGQKIAQMVTDLTLRGVSVDVAVSQFEVGPKSDYFDDEGNWIADQKESDDEGDMLDLIMGDGIFVITEGTIGAVTVCPFPAFAEATISVADSLVAGANPAIWTVNQQAGWITTQGPAGPEEALTASAAGLAPVQPPAAWFEDPEFDGPTALSIDDEGRLSGHAAVWGVCHIGIPNACTTAPHSQTDYAHFLLKEIECADGERVSVGTITLDTNHADRHLNRADTVNHYDHSGTAVADVMVGEDEFGIWVSGALRPDVDAEKARKLSGAVLSGDWRGVNGNLELVALLAVNVPGFPVPRTRALVAAGEEGNETLALVAAGINIPGFLFTDPDEQATFQQLVARAKGEKPLDQFQALAARARGEA